MIGGPEISPHECNAYCDDGEHCSIVYAIDEDGRPDNPLLGAGWVIDYRPVTVVRRERAREAPLDRPGDPWLIWWRRDTVAPGSERRWETLLWGEAPVSPIGSRDA